MLAEDLIRKLDAVRRKNDLLTIEDIMQRVDDGAIIYDPFSVLISRFCVIGTGNVFYPGVSLICGYDRQICIGNNNIFYSNTLITAETGAITIGNGNQFGEGGLNIRANREGAQISIGDEGRYLGGASIYGVCRLGSGSQILGAMTVDSCNLEAGGSFRHEDPDHRAGLLKGNGTAKNLHVPVGHVIAGTGIFCADDMKPQSFFHPKR